MADFESARAAEHALGPARLWQVELDLADDAEHDWRSRADRVVALYRGDGDAPAGKRFNILWSNTETLRPALYARPAKPDVRRRFQDADPLGRHVAMVLERALAYTADAGGTERVMEAAVQDMLLAGRGVVWLAYEPEIAERTVQRLVLDADDGVAVETAAEEYVADQRVRAIHVPWRDFRMSPARCWTEVRWVARRHRMSRDELEREFPDHAEDVPLDWMPDTTSGQSGKLAETFRRAEVWEIWDRVGAERLWLVKGYDHMLDREADPYGLDGFFPCPEPLYGVRTADSLVPIPEYTLYQDQAAELDEITTRIHRLVRALKRRGVYDGQIKELRTLAEAGDNHFVPVESFATLQEKGGLPSVFQSEDIAPVAQTLVALHRQRTQTIGEIYEITGISDLIRGAADPRETATAARIKGTFGTMRMKARQTQVQRFVRDLYRLQAELIAEHFEPEVLARMTGLAVVPAMADFMRGENRRDYAIDIETDSTVFEDAEAEKRARVEFLGAMSGLVRDWLPLIQISPALAPLIGEMIRFGARGFKVGRQLEDGIDQAARALAQEGGRARSARPTDPKAAGLAAETRLRLAKMQSDAAVEARGQDIDAALRLRGQNLRAATATGR